MWQIGKLFEIFLKKALITRTLSILLCCISCNSICFVQGYLTGHFSTISLISNPAVLYIHFTIFCTYCTFQDLLGSLRMSFFLFKEVCKGILAKKQDFAYLDLMQGPGK